MGDERLQSFSFLAAWGGTWIALNLGSSLLILSHFAPMQILLFLIVQVLNLGVSYSLVNAAMSVFLRPLWPPRLVSVESEPRVALLYLTCDDFRPNCLRSMCCQTYRRYSVFVLDDSQASGSQHLVDCVALELGACVVRRGTTKGFKAGSLNNWLANYGDIYEYFVVADADSLFPRDFVESMLRYAEHESNGDATMFQSKIQPWNRYDYLAWAEIATLWIGHRRLARIGNRFGHLVNWGHNGLYRTSVVRQMGGFDEQFTCEDLAFAIDCRRSKRRTLLVDVVSYEAVPETLERSARRTSRWARQTLQLLIYKPKDGLPLLSSGHLFMNAIGYALPFLFLVGSVLLVWGNRSLVRGPQGIHLVTTAPRFALAMVMLSVYLLALLVDLPAVLLLRKVSLRGYFRAMWIRLMLSLYSLMPTAVGLLTGLAARSGKFSPTGSHLRAKSAQRRHRCCMMVISFLSVVLVIGISRNPISAITNWFWMIPIITAPLGVLAIARRCPPRVKGAGTE